MSISDRYRSLAEDIRAFINTHQEPAQGEGAEMRAQGLRSVGKGYEVVEELREGVGEIPRIRLEDELTPVLMRAHNHIDRGRLEFVEAGEEKSAAELWEVQQTIYRLLNDL